MKSFPRPRGDGPVSHADIAPASVSPAYAGMVPPLSGKARGRVSPPTRGWSRSIALHRIDASPPPTRGWSRRSLPMVEAPRVSPPPTRGWSRHLGEPKPGAPAVSPAYAGMVPHRQHAEASQWSPPPTRGWSRSTDRAECEQWSPPPTRGWSLFGSSTPYPCRSPPPTRGWSRRSQCRSSIRWQGLPRLRGDGPVCAMP